MTITNPQLTVLDLWVPGHPVPQGSMTPYSKAMLKNGRPLLAVKPDNEKRLKPWRKTIAAMAREQWQGRPPLECDLIVTVQFHFKRPGYHYGTGKNASTLNAAGLARPRPTIIRSPVLGDVDKLLRAVLDAVDAGDVYADDSLVHRAVAEKVWGPEYGVRIWVQRDRTEADDA